MDGLFGLFLTLGVIYGTIAFFVGIVIFCAIFLFILGFIIYHVGGYICEKLRKQNKIS